jgi:hypothetical protein
MDRNAPTLTQPQEEAARLLAIGRRPSEVAEAVGVTRSTVSVWRSQPALRERVAALRADLVEQTLGQATEVASVALRHAWASALEIDDAAKRSRAMLELWKATSGRVGLPETTRTEHEGSGLSALVDRIDAMTDAERAALAAEVEESS